MTRIGTRIERWFIRITGSLNFQLSSAKKGFNKNVISEANVGIENTNNILGLRCR